MPKIRAAALALAVLVAGLGLSACGEKRWCEHDATDRKVADRYCQNSVPGYEWETGGKTKIKKSRSKRH